MLLHLKSGLFLTARKAAARLDPSCREGCLAPGSLGGHFKIKPVFKAQA